MQRIASKCVKSPLLRTLQRPRWISVKVPKEQHVNFDKKVWLLGAGSIGQGVAPLILRHCGVTPDRMQCITGDDRGKKVMQELGVSHVVNPITKDNYQEVLKDVAEGDFILNVTVDVSSVDVARFAMSRGAHYLDTVVEPWGGHYTDTSVSPSARSNYALREGMLKVKKELGSDMPTAVSTHGANPGMVNHMVKDALLHIARDTGHATDVPKTKVEWATLARDLGIKVIHIAERDTQVSTVPKERGEFVNTWSIDGFVGEGMQPAELAWGTHEKGLPKDGAHHGFGSGAAIYLNRPGASQRVRTWTPMEGPFLGFLITHNESISLGDYFSLHEDGKVAYRPTVHYAYHPCDDAVKSLHELQGKAWKQQDRQRLMNREIAPGGVDELGVLLMGHKKGAYWYGSQLSIDEARQLAPYNTATSLQVTSACLAGMVWAIENPRKGYVEPEEMDHKRVMEVMSPYLGPLVGEYTNWTPLDGRGVFYQENIDMADPWQFKNIRVEEANDL